MRLLYSIILYKHVHNYNYRFFPFLVHACMFICFCIQIAFKRNVKSYILLFYIFVHKGNLYIMHIKYLYHSLIYVYITMSFNINLYTIIVLAKVLCVLINFFYKKYIFLRRGEENIYTSMKGRRAVYS